MKRHEQREKAMFAVYQYLLIHRDVEELIEDCFSEFEEVDPYFTDIVHTAVENEERYAGYIDTVIKKGWKFSRLGCIEKAILLNGCAEFDLKKVNAAVIIDEAIRMAKKYCDKHTYKLINSVLDVI